MDILFVIVLFFKWICRFFYIKYVGERRIDYQISDAVVYSPTFWFGRFFSS